MSNMAISLEITMLDIYSPRIVQATSYYLALQCSLSYPFILKI